MTTLRNALGHLQNHPDDERAWSELEAELTSGEGARRDRSRGEAANGSAADTVKLLDAARSAHAERRESDAVARLLELEAAEVRGTSDEAPLLRELARVYDEDLFDDARAVATCERLRALVPEDRAAAQLLDGRAETRAGWADIAKKDLEESKTASAASFQSALLVSASEHLWRYGRGGTGAAKKKAATRIAAVEGFLERAVTLDPKNRRGALLLERVLLGKGDWKAIAHLLERVIPDLPREQRVTELLRLARLYKRKLELPEKAAETYASVIDLAPGQQEATSALVDHFTTTERWDELATLYEEHLLTSEEPDPGVILQVAMVNWKMRNRPEAAEPFFERLRRAQPGHQMALEFFRGYCRDRGEGARLAQILVDAERALPPGAPKSALAEEISGLAQEGASATKAIEHNRHLLRQDASNVEARETLKRLYRQTASWNALADLLRGELERIDPQDARARLPVLAEVAAVYREHIKSDSALVTVLSQIVQLAPDNVDALRELSRVYEQLGRWRDLLNVQTRLAELETRPAAKTELYRTIAKRWLDQFSNVQNASEAYEKLLEVTPSDEDAMARLRELYTKRRAYRPLYELLNKRSELLAPGPARRELWSEMARIASERLERGGEAVYLYKKILDEEPGNAAALDALEKQAERDRDFPTVAGVVEKRVDFTEDPAQKLVLLQRLGAVYADRLQDQEAATRTWRRVLDLSPGNAKAMRVLRDSYLASGSYDALQELYAKGNDWEALAEVFSGAADRGTDAGLKVELSFRAADVYATKLNAPERAFRAYERVLAARPDDARAAAALIPLYEKDEKWPRLPALYEIALRRAVADSDEKEQLVLLGKLGQAAEKLQDRGGAFAYARRAYELAPEAPGALQRLEEAARSSGAFTELASTLAAATSRKEGPQQREVRARLASTYAQELGDVDAAVATYKDLIEADERDVTAMAALDRLLRAHDRRDDLRWLFGLRVARANTKHKLELLGEWALLEEEVFAAPDRAAVVFKKMLELVPNHGAALRALARLLRELGDSGGAVEALERDRDQRHGIERGARELEIARLYIGQLGRPADALAAVERALVCFADDEAAVDPRGPVGVLEDLLNAGETRATAARLLEGIYDRSGTRDRQAAVLEVMIATAAARGDRLRLFGKLADVKRSMDDVSGAFDVVARAAFEYPTELALWDKLAELAQATGRWSDLGAALSEALPPTGPTDLPGELEVKLSERAATLYLDQLGDGDRAQPYLARILARHPGDSAAFEKSKAILTAKERWSDVEGLYERTMDAATDRARKVELLGELAIVAEEITGDTRKATRSYERILEIDPGQEAAGRALEGLYTRGEDWPNLAKLLTDRLERMAREGAATASVRDALKRQLAHLCFERVGDPDRGLDLLEELLASDVGDLDARDLAERALGRKALRQRAAGLLERVYAERNETRNLVRILGVRLELAETVADRRELLHRIAELRDEKLTDDAGAFEAYALYLPIAPDDSAARGRMLEIGKRTGAIERAAEVLSTTADEASSPSPKVEILADLANLIETRLNDRRRAEDTYRTILVLDPDDPVYALGAAQALARIYLAEGKHVELAHMLKAEIRLEPDAGERRLLLRNLAEICERELGHPAAAIEAWRTRLESDPVDVEALAALDRLYERTSDWLPLVETLRARERLTDDAEERRGLMGRIAVILAERLQNREEAILAYRALIEDFGAEPRLLRALGTLYAEAEQYPELADTIEAELAIVTDEETQLALLTRLGS
jgi:predicted O-linked N-acetylglucosamine transferase (SPINDLY family)